MEKKEVKKEAKKEVKKEVGNECHEAAYIREMKARKENNLGFFVFITL
jgi:hypothetical protein